MWFLVLKVVKFFFPSASEAGNNAVGMFILQGLRVCTVITLATMCASFWVYIIRVDKSRAYFVFECASLFFNSIICVLLILSEFPLCKPIRDYFRTSWPVLSELHGVSWLGGAMLLLGCDIFGNLNKPANEKDKLGSHFFGLVLAAGILAVTFGVLNVICGFVWRNGKEGITSRDIRSKGPLAQGRRQSLPDYSSSAGSSFRNEKLQHKVANKLWEKATGAGKKEKSGRPNISGPVDVERGVYNNHGANYDYSHESNIDRRSPIVPDLRRPDSALHPANQNISGRSSEYSQDTNRF